MERVRSTLRDHIERRTGHAPVLGRWIRSFQLHFLYKLRTHIVHQAAIAARNKIECAVYRQVAGVRPVSIDVLVRRRQTRGNTELVRIRYNRTRHHRHQLNIIASVQRQVSHLLGVDHTRQFTGSGVQCFAGGCRYFHRLRKIADHQMKIDGQLRVGNNRDIRFLLPPEAGLIDLHRVIANRQLSRGIESAAVGCNGSCCLCPDIQNCDSSPGNSRAAWVGDGTGDTSETGLGKNGKAKD